MQLLAPSVKLLMEYNEGLVTPEKFTKMFHKETLDKLNPVEIYTRITDYYSDKVTLLCFEKRFEFCHRHIVAKWLSEANGVQITEL